MAITRLFLKSLEVGLLAVEEVEDALVDADAPAAPVEALLLPMLALLGLLLRWLRLCASNDATVFFFGIDTPRPNRLDCVTNNNNNNNNNNNKLINNQSNKQINNQSMSISCLTTGKYDTFPRTLSLSLSPSLSLSLSLFFYCFQDS